MPICLYEAQAFQRCGGAHLSLLCRNINALLLVPFRLAAWWIHFSTLLCVTRGSEHMILTSSLAQGYAAADYVFLRHATDLCLAASFICLFFNAWGIVTSRTLRFGVDNWFQGCCHATAAVLLIVSWQATAHVARIWHVFYIFSIIPTGIEAIALAHSYWRGLEYYC